MSGGGWRVESGVYEGIGVWVCDGRACEKIGLGGWMIRWVDCNSID